MSVEKSVIKAGTIHEIGVTVDDRLEATKREMQQMLGQKVAFQTAMKAVQALHANVDAELADGKLDLAQGELAKKWVTRAVLVTQNLGLKADAMLISGQGKLEALAAVVEDLKKRHAAETVKTLATEQTVVDGLSPHQRVEGQHPGPGPKVVRLSDRKKKK